MRSRQLRALALSLSVVFAASFSLPASAAPGRDDGGRHDLPGITKIVKSVIRFVLHPLDELGLPHP